MEAFMARVTDMPPTMGRPVWIWDVDYAVGAGGVNRRGDVGLVQASINHIMRARDLRDSRKPFNPRPENPLHNITHGYPLLNFLVEDGYCGKETVFAIKTYQIAAGGVVDSKVSPVHPLISGKETTFIDVVFRAMYALNKDSLKYTGRLLAESNLPPFTRMEIKNSRF
jgi:hypothetical protein